MSSSPPGTVPVSADVSSPFDGAGELSRARSNEQLAYQAEDQYVIEVQARRDYRPRTRAGAPGGGGSTAAPNAGDPATLASVIAVNTSTGSATIV